MSSKGDELDLLIQQKVDAIMNKVSVPSRELADKELEELMARIREPEVKRCDEIEEYLRMAEPQKPETQQYVRDLMKTCFQVEEDAAKIKGKYLPSASRRSVGLSDVIKAVPKVTAPLPSSSIQIKALSKEERQVLAAATQSEEQAEEAMLALQLLQQYKKDPNFIQKELKDQAKRREQVLGDPQPQQRLPQPKQELFNPLLTQEERHRAIQEKREQRKKDQKLKQLEQSRERRKEAIKPKLNSDLESVQSPLDRIRETKLKIEQDAKESQEEVKKIKEELQRYKKELLEQEKARSELEAQQELKKKLNEDRNKMEEEVRRAKQQMNEYRMSKFLIIVNAFFAKKARQEKGQTFQALTAYSQLLKFKEAKLAKIRKYQLRAMFFRQWWGLFRRLECERDQEREEKERREEEVKQITAEGHRKRHLRRSVIKALKKNARAMQLEREVEQEHETRKLAIDDFFGNLREKARLEEERLKKEKLDKLQRDQIKAKMLEAVALERACTPILTDNSTVPFFITPSQLTDDTINFDQYKSQHEENKQSLQYDIVPGRQFDSDIQQLSMTPTLCVPTQSTPILVASFDDKLLQSASSDQASSQQSSKPSQPTTTRKLPERPKQVLEMEMRAKERKDKREQLKQAYEEKQRKAEEEKKQAEARKEEERKKKLQQDKDLKKQAKLEDAKRKEDETAEIENERIRIHEARQYYKRGLMIRYGIIPLLKNIEIEKQEMEKAELQNIKWIQRNGLTVLRAGVLESKLETKRRDDRMMYVAIRFHERNLIRNSFEGFFQLLENQREKSFKMRRFHIRKLMIQHLRYWKIGVPMIREEKKAVQAKENLLVRKFRMVSIHQLHLIGQNGKKGASSYAGGDKARAN